MNPYKFMTFDEALDDLIEDWTGEENDEDIISSLLAKADEMQPKPKLVQEKPHVEEEDQG
jgi:hypothetical protein